MTLQDQNQNFQRNIYLADDDDDDRAMFEEALLEVDSSVILTQAGDGEQLLEILSMPSKPLPEVILLDINMPKPDGFDCLEKIRSHNGNLKEVSIIIFSTCNNPTTIDRAFELGATFYAVKPNTFDGLKSFIKEVLQIDRFSADRSKRNFRLL